MRQRFILVRQLLECIRNAAVNARIKTEISKTPYTNEASGLKGCPG
jgi:hypothetical protein